MPGSLQSLQRMSGYHRAHAAVVEETVSKNGTEHKKNRAQPGMDPCDLEDGSAKSLVIDQAAKR